MSNFGELKLNKHLTGIVKEKIVGKEIDLQVNLIKQRTCAIL
jgi:hypothetical protein